MIVMKFGGSSVADAERIRRVIELVRARLPKRPVVVVSALKGVTDDLIALANAALGGDDSGYRRLKQRHLKACAELELDAAILTETLNELSVLTKGISLVRELTPRTLDYLVSFGERLSARLIAAAFTAAGIEAEARDAFEIGMLTDDNFGGAQPIPEAYAELKRHISTKGPLPVITGFIGKSRGGDLTTLGRNGSDFTASIVGAALGASEIQIWTDVDGVMTADPTVVPEARPIERMTFQEASELAYYGGRVLHPSTIAPAIEKAIPVRVLNTFKPEHPGTSVVADDPGRAGGVRAVVHKRNQIIVNVTTPRMLMGHGFLARIFEIFARHRIVVNMVSTSEVSVSVTVDDPRRLEAAEKELTEFATVRIEHDRAIVCVVGEGMRTTRGIAAKVFEAVRKSGVTVLMISQGASKINLAFVVANDDAHTVVKALHAAFFA